MDKSTLLTTFRENLARIEQLRKEFREITILIVNSFDRFRSIQINSVIEENGLEVDPEDYSSFVQVDYQEFLNMDDFEFDNLAGDFSSNCANNCFSLNQTCFKMQNALEKLTELVNWEKENE